MSEGVVVGVGANCGCHFGDRNICKKAFTFLKEDEAMTLEDRITKSRRLAKGWLLLGRRIPVGSKTGRKEHLAIQRAEDIPQRPEAELDVEASRLA